MGVMAGSHRLMVCRRRRFDAARSGQLRRYRGARCDPPRELYPDSLLSPHVRIAERWTDAARRPLGAYFRVNNADLVAMHSAIAEAGILYATSSVHAGIASAGWDHQTVRHRHCWSRVRDRCL